MQAARQPRSAIFEARVALLSGPFWMEEIESTILKERTPAMQALWQVTGRYREQFLSLEDDYMRERASSPLMIIDGERGLVIINPEEETIRAYRARQNIVAIEEKAAYENRHDLAHTKDGKRIVVAANISRPEELDSLLDSGAEGVGLFRTAGKWVGMCGEMAGDLQAIPLLLGMGLDEFSMSGPAIAQAKALIRACDLKACRVLAREALQKASAEEVKKRLGRVNLFHETPITGKPAYET